MTCLQHKLALASSFPFELEMPDAELWHRASTARINFLNGPPHAFLLTDAKATTSDLCYRRAPLLSPSRKKWLWHPIRDGWPQWVSIIKRPSPLLWSTFIPVAKSQIHKSFCFESNG
jgi:hypothetical protein